MAITGAPVGVPFRRVLARPLGVALLLAVLLRAGLRIKRGSPSLPEDMPLSQRIAAKASHLVLFAAVLLHLAAALFHGLIRRDGVFSSMAHGRR